MKKIFINIGFILGLFTVLLLSSCEEKINPVVEELTFNRAFSPIGLTGQISNVITVTLNWTAGKNVDHYVVEIYEGTDSLSATLVHTDDIASPSTTYNFDLPAGDTWFFARLKVVSSLDGVGDSKWNYTAFKTAPENLFTGYKSELSGLNACIVRWKPGSAATALAFDNGTSITPYTITANEITAGEKVLSGVPNANYTVRLMNTTFTRGTVRLLLEGDVQLGTGDNLATALTSVPAGGVILLTNGAGISFTGPLNLTKSVKIRGVYSTNLPKMFAVLNAATFHMFNIDAALTPSDSLVFENLTISGYPDDNSSNTKLRGMFDQDVTFACNIGTIKYNNCILRDFDRHLIRLRGTAAQIINKIEINNCIMYNYAFGSNYGVINSSNAAGKINNINIAGSTIFYTRGAVISYTSGTACQGITISNCTFDRLAMDAGTGRYLIDMNNTTGTGTIAISNCIFGKTSTVANGIRPNTMTVSITGSYYTSDFNDGTTFPIKSSMTAYSGASTALWVDPLITYDFHFLDTNFTGKSSTGDPRWRP